MQICQMENVYQMALVRLPMKTYNGKGVEGWEGGVERPMEEVPRGVSEGQEEGGPALEELEEMCGNVSDISIASISSMEMSRGSEFVPDEASGETSETRVYSTRGTTAVMEEQEEREKDFQELMSLLDTVVMRGE